MPLFLFLIYFSLTIFNVNAKYELVDDYTSDKFADMFNFKSDKQTSFTKYADYNTAVDEGLFKIMPNKSIYIGADSTNKSDNGRRSINIHSKKYYNHGLFIFDFAHIPVSVCGTWPMLWFDHMTGNRNYGGELHLTDGSNQVSLMKIYTINECFIANTSNDFTGNLFSTDCKIPSPSAGCGIRADHKSTFGEEFNKAGGGAYALEWTSEFIKIWQWSKSKIPADIKRKKPDPSKWSKPLVKFAGECDFDQVFHDQTINFQIEICPPWYDQSHWIPCEATLGRYCILHASNHPEAFKNSYWIINSLRVYQPTDKTSKTTANNIEVTADKDQRNIFTRNGITLLINDQSHGKVPASAIQNQANLFFPLYSQAIKQYGNAPNTVIVRLDPALNQGLVALGLDGFGLSVDSLLSNSNDPNYMNQAINMMLSRFYSTKAPETTMKATETTEPPQSSKSPPVTESSAQKSSVGVYLAIFLPLLALAILLCICLWFCHRKSHKKRSAAIDSLARKHFNIKERVMQMSRKDPWKIRKSNVQINYAHKLGFGAFADVHIGKLIGDSGIRRVRKDVVSVSRFRDCDVAVKILRTPTGQTIKEDFQQEIEFMKALNYQPHIVCFLGYVPDIAHPLLIFEYCANGDLLHFVRANRKNFIEGQSTQKGLRIKDLVCFAWQISDGLNYLANLELIHRQVLLFVLKTAKFRDVAARNVLLDKENVCKIGDFGLCRTAQLYTSRGGKLPLRWMAMESLKALEYTQKTDVWSFGVLLYELFSLGEVPYVNLGNGDVLQFLESGKRLQKPMLATDEIYKLMLNCWEEDPKERKTFAEICLQLTGILEVATFEYGYVDVVNSENLISESTNGSVILP